MAGDEDKKKKKKSKKGEEAPPQEPEPEPVQEAAPAGGGFADDDGDDWLSGAAAETDEAPVEQAPAGGAGEEEADWFSGAAEEGAAPAEGLEGEEGAEMPPQPKKKPKFFVHWNRRKPKFYDYNFDYGTNYYSSMVGYVDSKNAAFGTRGTASVPRRMAFAERGMVSSLERHRNPDLRTETLLHDIRSNIRSFETSQKIYAYGKK